MQVANRDLAIRERAYAIWEEEGRPSGRDEEHWLKAKREFAAPAPSNPAPAEPAAAAVAPMPSHRPASKTPLRRFFMARGAL